MKRLLLVFSFVLLKGTCFATTESSWYTVIDTSGPTVGEFGFSPSPVEILNSLFARRFEGQTFVLSFILRFHFLSDSMTIVYSGLKEYNNVVNNETIKEIETVLQKQIRVVRKNENSIAWRRYFKQMGDGHMLEERYCYVQNAFVLSPSMRSGLQPLCQTAEEKVFAAIERIEKGLNDLSLPKRLACLTSIFPEKFDLNYFGVCYKPNKKELQLWKEWVTKNKGRLKLVSSNEWDELNVVFEDLNGKIRTTYCGD